MTRANRVVRRMAEYSERSRVDLPNLKCDLGGEEKNGMLADDLTLVSMVNLETRLMPSVEA